MKICILLAAILVGCNATEDRPETLAYITETILAPSCGTTNCHSSMIREYGYAFDSVAAAQDSLANGLIARCAAAPCSPGDSQLIVDITRSDGVTGRMPLDAPLANKDIELIATWIEDGAFGYTPPGIPQ
jgi:hypothetical protein